MRDILGLTELTTRFQALESRIGAVMSAQHELMVQPQAPPPDAVSGFIAQIMPLVIPMIPKLMEALTAKVLGGEALERPKEALLWDEIEKRYKQRISQEMAELADRVVSGKGLLIEEPAPKDIGKPDGKGLQK